MKTHIVTKAKRNSKGQGSLPRFKRPALKRGILLAGIALLSISNALHAQGERLKPRWIWGIAGAGNVDFFGGSTQKITNSFTAPDMFTEGFGIGGYGGGLLEFRRNSLWGITFDAGFDNRHGELHYGKTYTNPGDLVTNLNSMSLAITYRIAPWRSALYFFAGPNVNFNIQKQFSFKQSGNSDIKRNGNWGYLNDPIISGQVGVGYDIPLSSIGNVKYTELTPFIAYLPYFTANSMRSVENLTLNTIRVGVNFKFGDIPRCVKPTPVVAPVEKEVVFNVQVPSCIRMQRMVKESLPLRNYVFFDKGSANIPDRYVKLTPAQATNFKEDQLQNTQSADPTARASRQLEVYHNMLNIIGDRMRSNPSITISLVGSSGGEGADNGKAYAESVKNYLVTVFKIDGSRISTEGRDRPAISSRKLITTQQFDLVDAEDRRVDIVSSSSLLEMPYGDKASMLKPAQMSYQNPDLLDTYVFFSAPGAKESLNSWNVTVTDDKGKVQNYGPYTSEMESVSGKKILGSNEVGAYKVVVSGTTKSGKTVQKESSINLVCKSEPVPPVTRFSILFEFDKSKTTETYAKFLTNVVAPAIKENSTVIIHGHTDIIGQEDYNMDLSKDRSLEAQTILQNAMKSSGKANVVFQTYAFGENEADAPFGNALPEERFYNRTVIIDIIPSTPVTAPAK